MSADVLAYCQTPVSSGVPDDQPAFKRRCYPSSLRHYSDAYADDDDECADSPPPPRISDLKSLRMPSPPQRRREILDLSINKLQTMNTRAPELRKSVLIFNTMRAIQDELDSEGGDPVSPVSSTDGDLELDFMDKSVPYTGAFGQCSEWLPPTQVYTDLSSGQTYGTSAPTSEIYSLSYEMLNNSRSSQFDYAYHHLSELAHPEDGDDDDGFNLNEEEVIAHLGLRDVVSAIMND